MYSTRAWFYRLSVLCAISLTWQGTKRKRGQRGTWFYTVKTNFHFIATRELLVSSTCPRLQSNVKCLVELNVNPSTFPHITSHSIKHLWAEEKENLSECNGLAANSIVLCHATLQPTNVSSKILYSFPFDPSNFDTYWQTRDSYSLPNVPGSRIVGTKRKSEWPRKGSLAAILKLGF